MTKREYVTTSAHWQNAANYRDCGDWVDEEEEIPAPEIPDGDDWQLVSSAASKTRLFWFWERSK